MPCTLVFQEFVPAAVLAKMASLGWHMHKLRLHYQVSFCQLISNPSHHCYSTYNTTSTTDHQKPIHDQPPVTPPTHYGQWPPNGYRVYWHHIHCTYNVTTSHRKSPPPLATSHRKSPPPLATGNPRLQSPEPHPLLVISVCSPPAKQSGYNGPPPTELASNLSSKF